MLTPGLATFPYTNGDPPYHGTYTISTAGFAGPGMHFAPGFVSNSGIFSYPYVASNSAYAGDYTNINPLGAYPGATSTLGGFNYNAGLGPPLQHPPAICGPVDIISGSATARRHGVNRLYVGSRGHNLWNEQDLNPSSRRVTSMGCPIGLTPPTTNCPATNSMFQPTPHTCTYFLNQGVSYAQETVSDGRANCDYKAYNAAQTNGLAWYDGLQVVLQKRVSHGLHFRVRTPTRKTSTRWKGKAPLTRR